MAPNILLRPMATMLGRIYFFDQGFYNKAEIYIKRALAIQEKQGAFVVSIYLIVATVVVASTTFEITKARH